jgi:hypothetical protein
MRAGVKGCANTAALSGRGASLMAFWMAAGAPAVPASPAPLAPSAMPRSSARRAMSISVPGVSSRSASAGSRLCPPESQRGLSAAANFPNAARSEAARA